MEEGDRGGDKRRVGGGGAEGEKEGQAEANTFRIRSVFFFLSAFQCAFSLAVCIGVCRTRCSLFNRQQTTGRPLLQQLPRVD